MSENLVTIHDDTSLHGTFVGYAKPKRKATATLVLRPKQQDEELYNELDELLYKHPVERHYLNHEELAVSTSFDKNDLEVVKEYLADHNLSDFQVNAISRELTFSGKVKDFQKAFNSPIGIYHGADHLEYKCATEAIKVPEELGELLYSFKGFYHRPKKESRKISSPEKFDDQSWDRGFSLSDISSAYKIPNDVKGSGQCIGLVELGGRHRESDIKKFFKLIKTPIPEIKIVGTDPGDDSDINNGEVSMDIQIAGAIAPEATLVIYYASTFIEALKLIINDVKNQPSVVSISWSAPEQYYQPIEKLEFDQLLYQAALLGITIIGSSGDHGAYNGLKTPNVPLPACHPLVLSCGGTIINIEEGERVAEMAWNEFNGGEATGGGYSNYYGTPQYQIGAISQYPYQKENGRGVPDVAALSSTIDGFQVIQDGQKVVVGGTSTASPMWAAMIALINEKLGYNLGFCNHLLYELAGTKSFNQIVEGNNLLYKAAYYWNPCTGLGSPSGKDLLENIQLNEPSKN